MPRLLATKLDLSRCPHCNVDTPNLNYVGQFDTVDLQGHHRYWRSYMCSKCGAVVTATAPGWDHEVTTIYPSSLDVSGDIPDRARAYEALRVHKLHNPCSPDACSESVMENSGLEIAEKRFVAQR